MFLVIGIERVWLFKAGTHECVQACNASMP